MVGVARIELATPAMSTLSQSRFWAEISDLASSWYKNEQRT